MGGSPYDGEAVRRSVAGAGEVADDPDEVRSVSLTEEDGKCLVEYWRENEWIYCRAEDLLDVDFDLPPSHRTR